MNMSVTRVKIMGHQKKETDLQNFCRKWKNLSDIRNPTLYTLHLNTASIKYRYIIVNI